MLTHFLSIWKICLEKDLAEIHEPVHQQRWMILVYPRSGSANFESTMKGSLANMHQNNNDDPNGFLHVSVSKRRDTDSRTSIDNA